MPATCGNPPISRHVELRVPRRPPRGSLTPPAPIPHTSPLRATLLTLTVHPGNLSPIPLARVRGKRGNARSDAPTIKAVCEHFFRSGFCEVRRCKHEHGGSTIEHLQNVPPAPESSDGCLPVVSKPLRGCDGGRVQVHSWLGLN